MAVFRRPEFTNDAHVESGEVVEQLALSESTSVV